MKNDSHNTLSGDSRVMATITNCTFEQTPPTMFSPITSRWNREHTKLSEWYYFWTITVWETKDFMIQTALKEGTIKETETTYKVIKPGC